MILSFHEYDEYDTNCDDTNFLTSWAHLYNWLIKSDFVTKFVTIL